MRDEVGTFLVPFDADQPSGSRLSTQVRAEIVGLPVISMVKRGISRRTNPVQSMLGYFGAAHSWTSVQNGGAVTSDPSVPGTGVQSLKVVPQASNFSQVVSPNLTATDLTNKNIRLLFRYTGNVTSIMVQPSNTTDFSNNRAQFNALDLGYTTDGQDAAVEIPVSEFVSNVGTFDKSAMTKLRVTVNVGAAGGTVWLYCIGIAADAVASLPNGAVTFSADDSFSSQRTFMAPTLARYGYAATLYPSIAGLSDGLASHLTAADAQYLQNVYGWDVGGHALNAASHVDQSAWSEAQLRAHFEAVLAQQIALGLRGSSYAWPLSQSSPLGRRIAADYFTSARGGSTAAPETMPPAAPYNYRAVLSDGGAKTLAQMKAYVDRAKAAHGVVHFLFHDFAASAPAANQVLQADFTALVDYVNTQGVPVYTQSQIDGLASA